MKLAPPNISLHSFALWCVILIPIAISLSRFAADLLLVITCIAFIIHAIRERRTDWLNLRWLQVAFILWGYLVLRALFTEEIGESVARALSWLRFPIFVVALQLWILQTPRHFTHLLYGLSLAVGFLIIDTSMQYLLGFDLLLREPIPAEMGVRLTGPYSSPIIGIILIWIAIPCITVWLTSATRSSPRSIFLAAFFSIGTLAIIFASGERMALLLTGLAFFLAFFLLPISKKIFITLTLLGAICLGLLATSNPNLIVRQIGTTHAIITEFSDSTYGQIWQSAVEMVKENPLMGVGLKHFRTHCPEAIYGATDEVTINIRCNLHPHNIYLEWLTESGAIGFCLFIFMLLLIARHVINAYSLLKMNPLFVGLLITICIRLWPLASTTSFFTTWSAVPFWFMIGWLLAMTHRKKELSAC